MSDKNQSGFTCVRCKARLLPGAISCGKCGLRFENRVPGINLRQLHNTPAYNFSNQAYDNPKTLSPQAAPHRTTNQQKPTPQKRTLPVGKIAGIVAVVIIGSLIFGSMVKQSGQSPAYPDNPQHNLVPQVIQAPLASTAPENPYDSGQSQQPINVAPLLDQNQGSNGQLKQQPINVAPLPDQNQESNGQINRMNQQLDTQQQQDDLQRQRDQQAQQAQQIHELQCTSYNNELQSLQTQEQQQWNLVESYGRSTNAGDQAYKQWVIIKENIDTVIEKAQNDGCHAEYNP